MLTTVVENEYFNHKVDDKDANIESNSLVVGPEKKIREACQEIGVDKVRQLAVVNDGFDQIFVSLGHQSVNNQQV